MGMTSEESAAMMADIAAVDAVMASIKALTEDQMARLKLALSKEFGCGCVKASE